MTRVFLGLLLAVLAAGPVRAHVLWVIPTAKGDAVAVIYSDSPRSDGGSPLRFTKDILVMLRRADGSVETLKGAGDKDAYRVTCPGTSVRTLAVVWNRFSEQTPDVLRTNLGKTYLPDPEGKESVPGKPQTWDDLGLEILPRPDKGADVYQVLYRGKPVEKLAVELYRPDDTDTDKVPVFTSDKDGLFTFKAPKPGRYGLLAEQTFDEKGTHAGKPFTRRHYWSTLLVEVPEKKHEK